MRGWDGTSWIPAKSWNGVWWNNLAITEAYVASFTGVATQIPSIDLNRSFTLIVKHNESTATYGRIGEGVAGKTRLRFYGNASILQFQLVRGFGGSDQYPVEHSWTKVAGQFWSSVVYDGREIKATYVGDSRTTVANISAFDNFASSGKIPLRCEATYSAQGAPIAILIPAKLTQAQIDQVISDFEASRTTKAPPALLAPVAPVANLGPDGSVTLPLPETSPRTMFFTASSNGAASTIRNANGAIIDNRLGLVNYDTFSRAVYVDRTATQRYLDNPGRSWAMSAWWDGTHAGLYSQRDSLTKQAEASLTPMPWTVVNGASGLRLLAYDQRLPDDRIATITHWLAWVER